MTGRFLFTSGTSDVDELIKSAVGLFFFSSS